MSFSWIENWKNTDFITRGYDSFRFAMEFLFSEYYNHISSMKKMKEEIPVIEEKMRNLSETLGWSANEAAFIRDAATTVTKVSRILILSMKLYAKLSIVRTGIY